MRLSTQTRESRPISAKPVPLDGYMADDLLQCQTKSPYPTQEDWIFASPTMKGEQRVLHSLWEADHIVAVVEGEESVILKHSDPVRSLPSHGNQNAEEAAAPLKASGVATQVGDQEALENFLPDLA